MLSGRADPGGRLPLTFYKGVEDLPPFDDYSMTGRTYRYFTGTPIYPFGYGLSFTSFAYSSLKVSRTADGGARVSAQVRNNGGRAGNEVAQLYLNFPEAPGTPRLALRGFQRLSLKPGEARTVNFELSPRDLSSVTPEGEHVVLAGSYTVSVGSGQPGTGVPSQSSPLRTEKGTVLPK